MWASRGSDFLSDVHWEPCESRRTNLARFQCESARLQVGGWVAVRGWLCGKEWWGRKGVGGTPTQGGTPLEDG